MDYFCFLLLYSQFFISSYNEPHEAGAQLTSEMLRVLVNAEV
jgi:hypothetical protein